jgi:hypothetical protein
MKVIKKFIAVLCSATMIVAAPLTAFASAPSSTAGAGNMFAYDFETVTVPTSIKLAFNPQGLPVTIGGTAEAPVTTTDKIVSLNYGIANKASTDKKIIVKFAANAVATDADDETEIEFVDASTKAQAKSDSNSNGAEKDEHKIFLYVTPATAQPTLNDGNSTAFAVTTGEGGAKTENASAANLANVAMTAAAEAKGIAFAGGTKNDAFANIGFALDKSTYALKAGESIGFETTQAEIADKLELSAFGTTSISGFTFKGEMNQNTVWTEANISSISITPTYVIEAKGDEAAVADTHGMVTLEAAEDIAEPDKPMTADGVAAAAFKTAHATVLELTAETVTGDAEELEAIEAAITAFAALSEDVQAILAAESTPITAETLAALKTASMAASGPSLSKAIISAADASVEVALPSGVTVTGLVLTKAAGGTVTLTSGTQYSVSGTTYTFTSTFLANQVGGTVTFNFSDGSSKNVSVQ